MSKNVWVQPQTVVQQFVANEYVASSCTSGTAYKFTCTGSKVKLPIIGELPFKWGTVYLETNNSPDWQESDQKLGFYHACSETHIANTTDEFLGGYLTFNYFFDTAVVPVIVWRGEDGRNIHCTDNLHKEDWEIVRS